MPTPTATPTPSPLLSLLPSFPFFNALGQTLGLLLQIVALLAAVYGFIRFVWGGMAWIRRPQLKLYISDNIWPVAEEDQSQFAINIQFVAYNPGKRMAALRRLEASLTRPEFTDPYPEKTFPLLWRHFI